MDTSSFHVSYNVDTQVSFGNLILPRETYKVKSIDEALEKSIEHFEDYPDKTIYVSIKYNHSYMTDIPQIVLILGYDTYKLKDADKGFIKSYYDEDKEIWYFDQNDLNKFKEYNSIVYNHNMIVKIYENI